jgi:hypothetical protein
MSTLSIADIVIRYMPDNGPRTDLINALVNREEGMAEALRMAGMQFGLYPQIVSEVLAQVEMGRPIEAVQREFIRVQYVGLMEELQRQHNEGHGGVQ